MTPEEYLKTTDCPDCHEQGGICEVCWNFEQNPEWFTMTQEEWERAEESADYIRKNGITPNLDSPY